jgi:Skp family chaperone for outer membrane proteins
MKVRNTTFTLLLAVFGMLISTTNMQAAPNLQDQTIGVVSFEQCMEKSKYGISKQNSYEAMRRQMMEILEKNNQELESTEAKVGDSDYLDGLTPKAVEQLKLKLQNLYQERGKFEQQFYQAISQGHNQLWNSMLRIISKGSEKVAKQNNIDIVFNEINAFYYASSLNITDDVIEEMDKMYEEEMGKGCQPSAELSVPMTLPEVNN